METTGDITSMSSNGPNVEVKSTLQHPDCCNDPCDTLDDDLQLKGCKPQKDKICLVCGDKALGYNFNAVSCESCKAFFRRNAFKEIRGRCEGKCEITIESRSYCKRCRLQKCFTIGMKRDLILNDQQKQQRRAKIQENRVRRQGGPCQAAADDGVPDGCSSSSTAPPPPDTLKAAAATEETHVIGALVDSTAFDGLTEPMQQQITELKRAFQLSFDCPMEKQPLDSPSSTQFLNMAECSVRRLVKMAKQLSVFRRLRQDDQISLLKGGVVEVLILRSSKMFDMQSNAWAVTRAGAAHSVSAAGLQFGDDESVSFFSQYSRFASSLLQATKRDNIVLMLMIVMVVLSPDRASMETRAVVASAQEEYANLLDMYTRLRYPGEPMLPRVLQKLADIRELNETHTRMLINMNIDELEPLIVEIFDMSL